VKGIGAGRVGVVRTDDPAGATPCSTHSVRGVNTSKFEAPRPAGAVPTCPAP